MTKKTIDTLVEDIYSLFDPKVTHTPSEENLDDFANKLKDILRDRLAGREDIKNPLRFSSLGKKDRQIWYMSKDYEPEDLTSATYFKFLYGDIIELLVLFLAREAGHTVEQEQAQINVEGVEGHIDAIVDGHLVDVKSASPYSFKKFKEVDKLLESDPFGYVQQLSGYAQVLTPNETASWVAFDKVHGSMVVSELSTSIINAPEYNVQNRIDHLKEVIEQDEPPARCYPDEEEGKSGNRKLGVGCSYCGYKHHCWPTLRTFLYSSGPVHLTKVVKTPNVPELV